MSTVNKEEFEINGHNFHGRGVLRDDGFHVLAGSIVRNELLPSATGFVSAVRPRLFADGILVEKDGSTVFAKDHRFDSPSGAAATVLGRPANGWIEWKAKDGTTLHNARRTIASGGLDPAKRTQIIEQHQQLLAEDKLISEQQLEAYYSIFRDRFGPEDLRKLDGEAMLDLIHDHSNRDSLVYWLEFKNDDEFDTRTFGSIAGGSALKFGIYRRKETGNWQTGIRANAPSEITVREAIDIARKHRDQFLKGIELLDALPVDGSDDDYAMLQRKMDELAPDVSNLAWGHKYFSMLFPDKLDSYHSPHWQRFHLLKLLQLPPEGTGRYVCAGRFIKACNEVGLPVAVFDAVLNGLHGGRHSYWRIDVRSGETDESHWPMMRDGNCIAVGWNCLGDLSWVEANRSSRAKLKTLVAEQLPNDGTTTGAACTQITNYVVRMSEGDIVCAADGESVLGIGRIVGEYKYRPESDLPQQHAVEWLRLDEWKMPIEEGIGTTVHELKKQPHNILETESRIQSGDGADSGPVKPINRAIRLTGIPARIQSIVDRKGQVILYGPPGTGKTYWAERTAKDMAAISSFRKVFDDLSDSEKKFVIGDGDAAGLVRICCFHPAYGYEDFLEGYRPHAVNDQVSFVLRDGVFKKLCCDANSASQHNFYLVVDEINRGDIPRIFGELLTTLESDKRGKPVVLPVSQKVFSVPKNVFVIGTMNTADRSISLLDAALRRRFGFVEMMPDGTVLKDSAVAGIPLRAWFDSLNARIREYVGRDSRNLQIGHSYLMQSGSPIKDLAALKRAVRDDIIPLLEEYCYEDYSTLVKILGDQLVDATGQRIRHELFDDGRQSDLVAALLAPCPDVSASSEAISSEESLLDTDEEEGEDDEAEES